MRRLMHPAEVPYAQALRRSHASRGEASMVFGKLVVIDLEGCDPRRVAEPPVLHRFAEQLVPLLGMRSCGQPFLEYHHHSNPATSGYTLLQPIDTSSVAGHFSKLMRQAHIDIFSCSPFDTDLALGFCEDFFRAASTTYTEIMR